jgi:8-hydroxy-5-deazaflavin:NADPH oxidoreductase
VVDVPPRHGRSTAHRGAAHGSMAPARNPADQEVRVTSVAIVGGTGPLGRGVAARLVRAGVTVRLGSRDPDRARAAADQVVGWLGGATELAGGLEAGGNAEVVADADVILLAVPSAGLAATVDQLAGSLAGRLVVSAVNPLTFDDRGPVPLAVEEGSAAELVAARVPTARVVAALHSVSSRELKRLDRPLDDDVPVLGDDEEAVAEVVALLERIDGCRPVAAGPLRLARVAEDLTCLLLSVNRRHRAHVGVRFTRL